MLKGNAVSRPNRPSQNHRNRLSYNWLAYNYGDRFLSDNVRFFKGILYDLGCGEMAYRDWFLQFADTYIGVDWSGTLHELKADIIADLNEALPIEDGVADTVISLSVIEHLREPQVFLNESYRILKPGGAMVLQVPFMWGVHEAPYDYYRYTCYGLTYMFEKAGYTNIVVRPLTGFWTMWTLKLNYQLARLVRGPWLVRNMISLPMHLIWAIDQRIAPLLDKAWPCEGETAGYIVVASKA